MTDLKEAEDKEVLLTKFYDDGFIPLFPQFKENDNRLIEFAERKKAYTRNFIANNTQLRQTSSIAKSDQDGEYDEDGDYVEEFDDDLISDDEFASLLNYEREIIVNDTLYKYTYSGIFSVHENDKPMIDLYIQENNIEYIVPEANTLERGHKPITAQISLSVPTEQSIESSQGCDSDQPDVPVIAVFEDNCNDGVGVGSGSMMVNHTQNLVDLMSSLDHCNIIDGAFDNLDLLGVSKKCYSRFNSKYRTKTKYWQENYLIYNSVGVKVKHQKKGRIGLWRAKKTDEVALVVSQASFEYSFPVPAVFPTLHALPKQFFFKDKIFNSQGAVMNYSNAIT